MAKQSLKSRVYDGIKEKIINCEYSPGIYLNEEALCETFNVSRTPIRDALGRLEQEGLVTIKPKKGVVISSLSISEVNNIFELRLLLEPYSLQHYGYTLNEEALFQYYQLFSSNNELQNASHFFVLDDQFHDFLNSAVTNHYIQENFKTLNTQNQRIRIMTGQRTERRLDETQKEHLSILQCCLKRDWDGAAQAMYHHLIQSKNATFELLLGSSGFLDQMPSEPLPPS